MPSRFQDPAPSLLPELVRGGVPARLSDRSEADIEALARAVCASPGLFQDMDLAAARSIAKWLEFEVHAEGEYLVRNGVAASRLHMVVDGVYRLMQGEGDAEGAAPWVATHGPGFQPGDVVGHNVVFDVQRANAYSTVAAVGGSCVVTLHKAVIKHMAYQAEHGGDAAAKAAVAALRQACIRHLLSPRCAASSPDHAHLVADLLAHMPAFRALPHHLCTTLASGVSFERVSAGTLLAEEDTADDRCMYVVVSGSCEVRERPQRPDGDGDEQQQAGSSSEQQQQQKGTARNKGACQRRNAMSDPGASTSTGAVLGTPKGGRAASPCGLRGRGSAKHASCPGGLGDLHSPMTPSTPTLKRDGSVLGFAIDSANAHTDALKAVAGRPDSSSGSAGPDPRAAAAAQESRLRQVREALKAEERDASSSLFKNSLAAENNKTEKDATYWLASYMSKAAKMCVSSGPQEDLALSTSLLEKMGLGGGRFGNGGGKNSPKGAAFKGAAFGTPKGSSSGGDGFSSPVGDAAASTMRPYASEGGGSMADFLGPAAARAMQRSKTMSAPGGGGAPPPDSQPPSSSGLLPAAASPTAPPPPPPDATVASGSSSPRATSPVAGGSRVHSASPGRPRSLSPLRIASRPDVLDEHEHNQEEEFQQPAEAPLPPVYGETNPTKLLLRELAAAAAGSGGNVSGQLIKELALRADLYSVLEAVSAHTVLSGGAQSLARSDCVQMAKALVRRIKHGHAVPEQPAADGATTTGRGTPVPGTKATSSSGKESKQQEEEDEEEDVFELKAVMMEVCHNDDVRRSRSPRLPTGTPLPHHRGYHAARQVLPASAAEADSVYGPVVRTLQPGDSFGELMLMQHDAKHISSVVAVGGDVEVVRVQASAYFKCIAAWHYQQLRQMLRFLGSLQPFARLGPAELMVLALFCKPVVRPAGSVVVQQGMPCAELVMVEGGELALVVTKDRVAFNEVGAAAPLRPSLAREASKASDLRKWQSAQRGAISLGGAGVVVPEVTAALVAEHDDGHAVMEAMRETSAMQLSGKANWANLKRLAVLGPGSLLGESVLSGSSGGSGGGGGGGGSAAAAANLHPAARHTASVVATKDSKLWVVSAGDLRRFGPLLSAPIAKFASSRQQMVSQRLAVAATVTKQLAKGDPIVTPAPPAPHYEVVHSANQLRTPPAAKKGDYLSQELGAVVTAARDASLQSLPVPVGRKSLLFPPARMDSSVTITQAVRQPTPMPGVAVVRSEPGLASLRAFGSEPGLASFPSTGALTMHRSGTFGGSRSSITSCGGGGGLLPPTAFNRSMSSLPLRASTPGGGSGRSSPSPLPPVRHAIVISSLMDDVGTCINSPGLIKTVDALGATRRRFFSDPGSPRGRPAAGCLSPSNVRASISESGAGGGGGGDAAGGSIGDAACMEMAAALRDAGADGEESRAFVTCCSGGFDDGQAEAPADDDRQADGCQQGDDSGDESSSQRVAEPPSSSVAGGGSLPSFPARPLVPKLSLQKLIEQTSSMATRLAAAANSGRTSRPTSARLTERDAAAGDQHSGCSTPLSSQRLGPVGSARLSRRALMYRYSSTSSRTTVEVADMVENGNEEPTSPVHYKVGDLERLEEEEELLLEAQRKAAEAGAGAGADAGGEADVQTQETDQDGGTPTQSEQGGSRAPLSYADDEDATTFDECSSALSRAVCISAASFPTFHAVHASS